MNRLIAVLFSLASLAVSAADTCVMADDFESPSADWRPCPGFAFVDGVGVGGSRALVWEQSKVRNMQMVTQTVATASGNAVRPMPTAVPERFIRRIDLEAGRVYTFSVKINGSITNNCMYVFLRWYNGAGKFIGSAEGRPTIYKQAGRSGWECVSASTQRLPSDVAYGELLIELYRTTLGRMVFDEFKVTCDEPRHVERMFSSAYRNVQESGTARFVVPYVAALSKFPRAGLSGEFTFVGPGGEFVLAADRFDDDHFEATVDVSRLSPGTHPVKGRLLCRGIELGSASLDFTRAKIDRKVTFDLAQRMLVEGKPFFPIGVYVHPADKEVPYLDRLRGTPFNCIIECSADRNVIDKYHAAGLKVIPKAPWKPEWARAAANGLRGHPALLAWYVIDEAPPDRADEKRALQRALEEADPDHPTFAVLDLPRNAGAMMGSFDIVSTDPYPIGRGRGSISKASEYPRICRERTWGLRPLWQVPQSMAWEWFHRYGFPKENRYPTYEELRSMAWQAIAAGANGLLWYSAHHIFKCSPPDELEKNWGDLVKVAEEVRSHVDVLQADAVEARSSSASIVVRAFRKDGEVWVLAANATPFPATSEVVIAGRKCGKVSLQGLGVEFRKIQMPSEGASGGLVRIQNASFEQVDADGYPVGWSKCPNWHGEREGHNGSGGIVYECHDVAKARGRQNVRQEIRLHPGKRYRLTAYVKTTNLKPERKTDALGLTAYMSGFDAKGKQIFGAAALPFVNETSKDWVKVTCLTAEVPDGIDKAYVGPLADGRCVGVGVVDDIFIEELDMAPVVGVFTDAYRNESTGGEVKFLAALNLDRVKVAVSDCKASFSYLAADGSRRSTAAIVHSHRDATATIDTTQFALGTNEVTFTVLVSGKEVGKASVAFARLAAPIPRKVYFDRRGRTIVDGKPFFPLGMFSGAVNREMLDIYAEGPFNCLMPYVRPDKAGFDLCHEKGLKVMFFLNGGWGTKDKGRGWIENRIAAFKDHPATLAWYMSDEPSLGMAQPLAVRRGWAHAADPDHPTWVVLDHPHHVRYYLDSFDAYAMDKYPVPRQPIEAVIESMRSGNAATLGMKPTWYVPQAFGWGWLGRPRTHGRGPNRDELANMTWQSIAGGANGIVYYSFGQVMKRPRDDSEDSFKAAWERVKSAAAEVKQYEAVLLSAEDAPVVSGATEAVAVRTWRHDGHIYLLAVNCTQESQKATLSLPWPVELISAEFGPAPRVDGTNIRLELNPIAHVMMKLKAQ